MGAVRCSERKDVSLFCNIIQNDGVKNQFVYCKLRALLIIFSLRTLKQITEGVPLLPQWRLHSKSVWNFLFSGICDAEIGYVGRWSETAASSVAPDLTLWYSKKDDLPDYTAIFLYCEGGRITEILGEKHGFYPV